MTRNNLKENIPKHRCRDNGMLTKITCPGLLGILVLLITFISMGEIDGLCEEIVSKKSMMRAHLQEKLQRISRKNLTNYDFFRNQE
jgi:hypothetical protein